MLSKDAVSKCLAVLQNGATNRSKPLESRILELVNAGAKGGQVDNSCCDEPEDEHNNEERRESRLAVAKTG